MKSSFFTLLAITATPFAQAAITCNAKAAVPLESILPSSGGGGSSSGGSYSGGGGGSTGGLNTVTVNGGCSFAAAAGATSSVCNKKTGYYKRMFKRATGASSFTCANSMTCISLQSGLIGCLDMNTGDFLDSTGVCGNAATSNTYTDCSAYTGTGKAPATGSASSSSSGSTSSSGSSSSTGATKSGSAFTPSSSGNAGSRAAELGLQSIVGLIGAAGVMFTL